jgi:MinD superfamily P-loop ATPase
MTYQISPSCEACNNCKCICPISDAIIAGDVYRIDEDSCIGCGVCVESCPTSSIYEPRIVGQEKSRTGSAQRYAQMRHECLQESMSLEY